MELAKEFEQLENKDKKEIPGPKGLELLKLGMMFQNDPLSTYDYIHRTYGDVVWCPWPNRNVVFLFHPDDLKRVMKDNQSNYTKSSEYSHMKPLLGEGLLTSDGEKWKNQRKIMAKEFHPPRIEEYFPQISKRIQSTLQELDQQQNKTFDVTGPLSKLTFQIAGEIFFGANVAQFSHEAREALENETIRMNKRMRRAFNIPFGIPTPENCKGKKSVATLDNIVSSIMESGESENSFNVLRKLMNQTPALEKNVIRDEVMTLLLAGHETTSNSLTWTLMYLCQHPEWQVKLQNELKDLGKSAAELSLSDMTVLKTFRSVIQEAIRLMPPIPAIGRKTIKSDILGGHEVGPNVSVSFFPIVTHRDPRFWEEPMTFKPERFMDRKDRKDDFTYFPFARGARACIGEELAMVESILILAHFVEGKNWTMADNFKPQPVHHLTLRSANGLSVRFQLE
ncbi:MAG: cytochrome P450 [Bdellovibrionales bacterium]|nr:cytochrome P450 [Bdellovibrionales bacterium]